MSILVALSGPNGALIATDSRCVLPDGSWRDDYPKVFKIPRINTVCGYTGLVEFGGLTIPQRLEALPLASFRSIDELTSAVKGALEQPLSALPPHFYRFVDVILVATQGLNRKGRPTIRGVVLRPNPACSQVVGEIRTLDGFGVTGDDQASNAARKFLDELRPRAWTVQRPKLKSLAREAIAIGIENCGPAVGHPNTPSCGAPPCICWW